MGRGRQISTRYTAACLSSWRWACGRPSRQLRLLRRRRPSFHDENLEMLPSEVARLAEVLGEEAEEEEVIEGRD
jgi:hypothetical protein